MVLNPTPDCHKAGLVSVIRRKTSTNVRSLADYRTHTACLLCARKRSTINTLYFDNGACTVTRGRRSLCLLICAETTSGCSLLSSCSRLVCHRPTSRRRNRIRYIDRRTSAIYGRRTRISGTRMKTRSGADEGC